MSGPGVRIDSHQHFWAINDTDYQWIGPEHGVIRRDFLPTDLEPLLAGAGIDGSVAVQARQTVEETEWLLGLADAHDLIRGVVGWIPLGENSGEPYLEKLASHRKLVGVRHVVQDEADDDFILGREFNEGIRRLSRHDLVYDILIFWKHLPQTIEFVDRHPGQEFVLDHIAKPCICGAAFDEVWAAGIRDLALRENVSCKLSGMLTEVRDDEWQVDLLRPYFETVLEAFGAQRILFGSDWPVCLLRAAYPEWVGVAIELVSPLSPDERTAFWGGTAERVYGLETPST